MKQLAFYIIGFSWSLLILPALFTFSLLGRILPKKIDVGLGPHPIISNVYHKRALIMQGFSAETFVYKTYYITKNFDKNTDEIFSQLPTPVRRVIGSLVLFCHIVLRYRVIYFTFHGGPLSIIPGFLNKFEAFFFKLARTKIVILPYGSDLQDMSMSKNLFFKHTMTISYPTQYLIRNKVSNQVRYWTNNADHIVSGVEWVDYMYHWDTLTLGHFSIDVDALPKNKRQIYRADNGKPLKILHAPNHRAIKGSNAIIDAVKRLQSKGHAVELYLIENQSNKEVIEKIRTVDLVIDQLVIGWYAMFAIEALALECPTICYIRQDLQELYEKAGLLKPGEMPFIKADTLSIECVLEEIITGKINLEKYSKTSRQYILDHHSLETIGKVFARINTQIGIIPGK